MEKRHRTTILNYKSLLEHISVLKLRPLLLEHKIFTKAMLNDICDKKYDLLDELVCRGPTAFPEFIKVLKESGHTEEAEILTSGVPKISKRVSYKIQSEPLGLCLIINNEDFYDQKQRLGSAVDVVNLTKIFEKIGYLVLVPEKNFTAEEMRLKLVEFSKDDRWKVVDSCIVIILSHGRNINNLDVVSGTNGEYLGKLDIINLFSNKKCPALINKPKIFIFQACRGDEEDEGVMRYESTDASGYNSFKELKKIHFSYLSDILVVHSALPYHKSYRHHEKGSWLCQDLVEVLSEDYLNCDFETMLKSVTRKVQNRLSIEGNKKQGIHLEPINLRADIYFNRNISCASLNI